MLLIELATAQYRAGQFADSLAHAVAAADSAEPAGRPDLVAAAALVLRGVGPGTPRSPPPCSACATGRWLRVHALTGCARGCSRSAPPRWPSWLISPQPTPNRPRAMAAAEAAGIRSANWMPSGPGWPPWPPAAPGPERLRLGTRAIQLATTTGQPLAVVLGRKWRIDAAYQLANLDAVDVEIGQIAASRPRPPGYH